MGSSAKTDVSCFVFFTVPCLKLFYLLIVNFSFIISSLRKETHYLWKNWTCIHFWVRSCCRAKKVLIQEQKSQIWYSAVHSAVCSRFSRSSSHPASVSWLQHLIVFHVAWILLRGQNEVTHFPRCQHVVSWWGWEILLLVKSRHVFIKRCFVLKGNHQSVKALVQCTVAVVELC